MIRFHYLKDVQRPWTINDLRDIAALSVAIPYCDTPQPRIERLQPLRCITHQQQERHIAQIWLDVLRIWDP
jgi:hypothetical protein